MGRGAATKSSSLIFGKSWRRSVDWGHRIKLLRGSLDKGSLGDGLDLARRWHPIVEPKRKKEVSAILAEAVAQVRWARKADEPGNEDEYAYLLRRIAEAVPDHLGGEEPHEYLADVVDQERWLIERPSAPGKLGSSLIGGATNMPDAVVASSPGLRQELEQDSGIYLLPLFHTPLDREVTKVEDVVRDLLAWCGVINRWSSPDFYVGASGNRIVHYEDPSRPGLTPCGRSVAKLKNAGWGRWRYSGSPMFSRSSRCKICEKRGVAPNDRTFDEIQVLSASERDGMRHGIVAVITSTATPEAREEATAEELKKHLRESLEDFAVSFASSLAAERFDRLAPADQQQALLAKLSNMGTQRDAIDVAKLDIEAKRRIISLGLEPGCRYQAPLEPVIREVMRCSAFAADRSDFIYLAKAFGIE